MAEELQQVSLNPEQLNDLRDLLQHPGWVLLLSVMDRQIKTREQILLRRRVRTQADIQNQEWDKGEVSGMRFSAALPQALIDAGHVPDVQPDDANEEGS